MLIGLSCAVFAGRPAGNGCLAQELGAVEEFVWDTAVLNPSVQRPREYCLELLAPR